ncbi:hypothetical protein [Thermosporothrix hazakensis]|uniref:hypothetical protein n=1 Tax=Thermosporothrix hazakensis TaxID=644383 RepID=UPI0010F470C7|nr:hypothetical protein [Thermosporothrix hazakensis]
MAPATGMRIVDGSSAPVSAIWETGSHSHVWKKLPARLHNRQQRLPESHSAWFRFSKQNCIRHGYPSSSSGARGSSKHWTPGNSRSS